MNKRSPVRGTKPVSVIYRDELQEIGAGELPSVEGNRSGAECLRQTIASFLAQSREPVFLLAGEPALDISRDAFSLDLRAGRVVLQVWDQRRNLSRKIAGIKSQRKGALELIVEGFAGRTGELTLIDRARPSSGPLLQRTTRLEFREEFRLMLAREFPDWTLEELSCSPDLEHSLSPSYPRALLRAGSTGLAAIAAPPDSLDAAGILTFGLLWLDHLRQRESRKPRGGKLSQTLRGLALFLPVHQARMTALRMPWLNSQAGEFRLYVYDESGSARLVDSRDHGNIETVVSNCEPLSPHTECWLQSLRRTEWFRALELQAVRASDGSVRILRHGLEVVKCDAPGSQNSEALDFATIERRARQLARYRCANSPDPYHRLHVARPESWLESLLRQRLSAIHPGFDNAPVYGQVPALATAERGIIDLLTCTSKGRVAIVEIKASQDIHLPLQALDYWIRVRWHLQRGEFTAAGYFPGRQLLSDLPELYLVAPALEFHPSTEVLLRYLSPAIPIVRIGVNADWRAGLRVMFQLRGFESPQ